jgi:hypothetical protein
MALLGHSSTHVPHPLHLVESIITSSFMRMACSGQISAQIPHRTHVALSTTALVPGIFLSSIGDFSNFVFRREGSEISVFSIIAICVLMDLSKYLRVSFLALKTWFSCSVPPDSGKNEMPGAGLRLRLFVIPRLSRRPIPKPPLISGSPPRPMLLPVLVVFFFHDQG